MEELGTEQKISRGKVLKRAGLGAAALWAAPMVASSNAWAGVDPDAKKINTICNHPDPSTGAGGSCGDACSVGVYYCNTGQTCGCGFTQGGCCTCISIDETFSCGSTPCDRKADCPSGFSCLLAYCCANGHKGICVRNCPNPGAAGTRGSSTSGTVKLH